MGLTSEELLRALAACGGEEPEDAADTVALIRRTQPSFAATLWSAWQAEGLDLNPALDHELAATRARIAYYRTIAARLRELAPGLVPIKGLEVADRYPDGLVRGMNDLDYVAPAEPDLWRAAGWLLDDGWDLHAGTFTWFAGALQVLVSFRRPHEDRYQLPYGVEFATYASLGDLGGVPPLPRLPDTCQFPVVKNLLMLLYERFEQPYRARDLVDAALQLGPLGGAGLAEAELAAWHRTVAGLGLWPEYTELVGLVERAGLGPLPPVPPGAWVGPATRAWRAARGIGMLTFPLAGTARHLQRRLVADRAGDTERRAWQLTQRRLPIATAVRAGLLAFGLPLDGPPPPVDRATLWHRDGLAWVDTPVARFLLTIGDEVTEDAVEQLTPHPEPAR